MLEPEKKPGTSHSFEKFLSIANAVLCTFICLRVAQTVGTGLFPLPALYLLELVALSGLVVLGVFRGRSDTSSDWGLITWIAAGVFLAFSLLGAWTIGFFFLPSTVLLVVLAVFSDVRQGRNIPVHLGVGLLAAILQAAIMLSAVRILHPGAYSIG